MSSVIRPSGPLPPRVYWVRRLLLLVVVVVLVGALWWLVSGLGDAQPNSPVAAPTTTAQPNPPVQSSGGPTSDRGSGNQHRHSHQQQPRHPGRHHHHRRPPLALPTGPCSPADVSIAVSADNALRGDPTTATLSLTSMSTPACTLEITPGSMVLRIVSHDGLLMWTSDDCPDDIPVHQVVVRTDPATTYTFQWDGRKSVEGCTSPGARPDAGDYRVEVALLGGDVYQGSFRIRP